MGRKMAGAACGVTTVLAVAPLVLPGGVYTNSATAVPASPAATAATAQPSNQPSPTASATATPSPVSEPTPSTTPTTPAPELPQPEEPQPEEPPAASEPASPQPSESAPAPPEPTDTLPPTDTPAPTDVPTEEPTQVPPPAPAPEVSTSPAAEAWAPPSTPEQPAIDSGGGDAGQTAPSLPSTQTEPNGQQAPGTSNAEPLAQAPSTPLSEVRPGQNGEQLSAAPSSTVVGAQTPLRLDADTSKLEEEPTTGSVLGLFNVANPEQTYDGTPGWIEGVLNRVGQQNSGSSSADSNAAAGVFGAEAQGGQVAADPGSSMFYRGSVIVNGARPLVIFTGSAVLGLGIVIFNFVWRNRKPKN